MGDTCPSARGEATKKTRIADLLTDTQTAKSSRSEAFTPTKMPHFPPVVSPPCVPLEHRQTRHNIGQQTPPLARNGNSKNPNKCAVFGRFIGVLSGGRYRTRICDLLHVKQAL